MKLPIILRTTHDLVVAELEKEIKLRDDGAITMLRNLTVKEETIDVLKDKNHLLNMQIDSLKIVVERYFEDNIELESEIQKLKNLVKKLEKEKQEAKFCAGTAKTVIEKLNKKLKVNTEAKRQIRDLIAYKDNTGKAMKTEQGNWVHEKIDGKKVWDLTMLIGE